MVFISLGLTPTYDNSDGKKSVNTLDEVVCKLLEKSPKKIFLSLLEERSNNKPGRFECIVYPF